MGELLLCETIICTTVSFRYMHHPSLPLFCFLWQIFVQVLPLLKRFAKSCKLSQTIIYSYNLTAMLFCINDVLLLFFVCFAPIYCFLFQLQLPYVGAPCDIYPTLLPDLIKNGSFHNFFFSPFQRQLTKAFTL